MEFILYIYIYMCFIFHFILAGLLTGGTVSNRSANCSIEWISSKRLLGLSENSCFLSNLSFDSYMDHVTLPILFHLWNWTHSMYISFFNIFVSIEPIHWRFICITLLHLICKAIQDIQIHNQIRILECIHNSHIDTHTI